MFGNIVGTLYGWKVAAAIVWWLLVCGGKEPIVGWDWVEVQGEVGLVA